MSLSCQIGLTIVIVVFLVFVVMFSWFHFFIGYPTIIDWSNVSSDSPEIEYYKLLQSFMDTLIVGGAVGLAAVVIPTIISSRREGFERYKDSRQTYSEASTGVMYLPERLAALDMENGMALINQVHEKKHIAETYVELKAQIERRSGTKTVKQWSDNMWMTLDSYKNAIGDNANDWDNFERAKKLETLRSKRDEIKASIPGYFT